MSASIFSEKAIIPTQESLSMALKDNLVLWNRILDSSGGKGEWKFYSKAAGWTLQVKKGKRALFYLMPKEGWLQMIFVFGERAVEAAKSADLPKQVLNDLLEARAHVEGRSITIGVTCEAEMDTVEKLLKLKLEY